MKFNKKKILSVACATAMILSTFSGLSVAHAELGGALVYENDGTSTADWSQAPTSVADNGSDDKYLYFVNNSNSNMESSLDLGIDLTDNYVIDFDTNIHTGNGMGRLARYLQIAFTDDNATKDTRDYQDTKFVDAVKAITPENPGAASVNWNSGTTETGIGYVGGIATSITSRVELFGDWVINDDGTNPLYTEEGGTVTLTGGNAKVGDDKWVRVRTEVSGGKAKMTIIDANGTNYIDDGIEFKASATKLSKIILNINRGDTNFISTGGGQISLDNIKIYDTTKGEVPALTTTGIHGKVAEEAAEDAPEINITEGTKLSENKFDDATLGTVIALGTEEQDDNIDYEGLSLSIGSRAAGGYAATNFAIQSENEGKKYLVMNSNNYCDNNRGPILKFTDVAELSDGQYIAAKFAAKLVDSKGNDGTTELIIKDGESILTTLTTNTENANAKTVEANKWGVYEIKVLKDKSCTITLDGENIYTGTMSDIKLPTLSGTQTTGKSAAVALDNIVVYTTGKKGEVVEILAPEVTAPDGAKVISNLNFDNEEQAKTLMTLGTEQQDDNTDYEGIALALGARSEGGGKVLTTWGIAKDYTADRYLKAFFGEYGGSGRTPTMKFTSKAALEGEQVLGVKFAAKLIDGTNKAKMTFTEGLPTEKDYTPLATVSTETNAKNNEWAIYEITVDANKNCTIKTGETELYKGTITGDLIPSVTGSNENGDSTAICFDNIVIYTTGTAVDNKDALAPEIKLPENAIEAFTQDFKSFTSKKTLATIDTDVTTSTDVDGMTITLGGRSDGKGDGSTYASVEKLNGQEDYVLQVGAGKYSTGGRTPVIDLSKAFAAGQLDDGDTTVVEFAAKLKDGPEKAAEIVFLPDEDKIENGAYRYVAGKITTGAAGDEVEVSEDNKNNGAYTYGVGKVKADEWIKVKIEVTKKLGKISENEVLYPCKIYVNDTLVSESENGRYRYGDGAIATLSGLPKIAFLDSASGDNFAFPYSTIQLDNFVAYKLTSAAPKGVTMNLNEGGKKVNVQSNGATGTAVLVQASYDGNGAMTNVTMQNIELSDKTATVAFDNAKTGDKYMLLKGINSLTPLTDALTADIKE